jgi:hypothetical protein
MENFFMFHANVGAIQGTISVVSLDFFIYVRARKKKRKKRNFIRRKIEQKYVSCYLPFLFTFTMLTQ